MKFKYEDGNYWSLPESGKGRPKKLDEKDLINLLIDQGVSLGDLEGKLDELKSEIKDTTLKNKMQKKLENEDYLNLKNEIINEVNPFRYLKFIKSYDQSNLILIWDKGNFKDVIGNQEALTPKDLINKFTLLCPEVLEELRVKILKK